MVGGDPYEIRVAVPNVVGPWEVDGVSVSEADRLAGVTVKLTGGKRTSLARVVITSASGREVSWKIEFVRARTEPPPRHPLRARQGR